MNPLGFVPDASQLASIFSQAVAPAFLLGAVAAFISLLMKRLENVVNRIGSLARIADSDATMVHLKNEIPYLKRRAVLLNTATYMALGGGICTTLLLMIAFASAFFKLQHIYGGGLLFGLANALLTMSLYKFAREVKAELTEIRQF